jgi:hypothetical protein
VKPGREKNVPPLYTTRLGPLENLKNDLALALRRRVFQTFMQTVAPDPVSRVADFGVSGHRDHPVHQFFELLYPYPQNLTAIGQASESAAWFVDDFPGVQYIEADLRSIPLPDNYFDAGLCNAVVEHAGTRTQQAELVREVCRVCKTVMFTTPNRDFPLELHTFLPLAHWLPDALFRQVLRSLGNDALADVSVLNPLRSADLMALFPEERYTQLLSTGPLVLQSNLMCVSWAPVTARSTAVAMEPTGAVAGFAG